MSSQILLINTLNPIVEVFSYLWFPALSQVVNPCNVQYPAFWYLLNFVWPTKILSWPPFLGCSPISLIVPIVDTILT